MEILVEPHKGAQTMASATRKEETAGSLFKSSIFDSVTPFEVLMVEEFSDLNLVIGSHIIGVHQLILASHSKLIAGDNYFLPSMKCGLNSGVLVLQEKEQYAPLCKLFLICLAGSGILGNCTDGGSENATPSMHILNKVGINWY